VIDNRTASGKGVKSEYGLYKNFGETELKDLEEGVSYLKSLPYVDGSRIGISGWSFGGYMTAYALTHSKNFKIGIAGGTVADWSLYRFDLHRTLYGNAAKQPGRLSKIFGDSGGERFERQTSARSRRH
jgi:dipeptidyl aminopeptidase/acylaminoacyl peptidase